MPSGKVTEDGTFATTTTLFSPASNPEIVAERLGAASVCRLSSDNDDGNTTLITLAGTYDGQPAYFPFRINDKAGTGEASSDGTFIRRNYVYTVNVKLKRLGGGSSNPEVPADPASLAITVEPQNWTAELVQDVEW